MPLPMLFARVGQRTTNHAFRRVAWRLPWFAVVTHVGRRSGRRYRTPVNLYRRGESFVIALIYGAGDWVANVQHAGGCDIETRGRSCWASEPRVVTDPRRTLAPAPVRVYLRMIGVQEFLVLDGEQPLTSEVPR